MLLLDPDRERGLVLGRLDEGFLILDRADGVKEVDNLRRTLRGVKTRRAARFVERAWDREWVGDGKQK